MPLKRSVKRLPVLNDPKGGGVIRPTSSFSFRASFLHMAGLALLDAVALWLVYSLLGNGVTVAGIIVLVVTGLINWVFLSDRLYPIRWLTPGLSLMLLLVVYPLVFTVYIAFTNYSDGHILSKQQVIEQLQRRYFQPPDAISYQMTVYRSPEDRFLLFLQDPQGNTYAGTEEEGIQAYQGGGEPPEAIGPYQRLSTAGTFQYLTELEKIRVSGESFQVHITGPNKARQALARYTYDKDRDVMIDNETGKLYRPVVGAFVDDEDKPLPDAPGFTAVVGLRNFRRVFSDPQIQDPFMRVFLWTVTFAAMTVLLAFSVGLLLALVLNDNRLPLRTVFRSIAIIPYAIPGFISILVWVGLLNPYYGPFSQMIKSLTGVSPDWFSNGTLTKVAILFINTWLGFPYMMLINLGALQSIPMEMYEAAELDGAGRFAKFRYLTLPLLLISVGPLLIGAFAFNFNNFTVIDLVNEGGPPIVGASTPAGQTDILISYTYRLAFAGGRGADFGLASTIAIFIFLIIATLTAFNFRFTRQLEEVMQ
ncbi:MAG: maltose ABC transporter permease MalF [Anaerolineales bacterium]|nr:maltose ABC transporter permease MalF [Anaerolineales bacterium]